MMKYPKILNAENSISHRGDFVKACIETMTKKVPYGIYNVTNTGHITTEQLVAKLKNTIAKDQKFELINEDELYANYAKTPRSNCLLDNSKLLNAGIKMRTVDQALDSCLANWKTA
jgi:UDP-glucose 4,6-dehydratase